MTDISSKNENTDILQAIQISGVVMEKHGKDWFGLCPFHAEKTPSFTANDQKQMFYCFGCGAGGDVIEYVMRFYKLDFTTALKHLGLDGEVETTAKARAERRRYRHKQMRAAREKRLHEIMTEFNNVFYRESWEMIRTIESAIKKLSADEVFELSDLIKHLSACRLTVAVLDDAFDRGDDETLYETWKANA